MALATSDLAVSTILSTLGVSTPKDIFRNTDGSLKTVNEIWSIVNRWGLDSLYLGGGGQSKIMQLLTDRKLSYFKGYDDDFRPFTANEFFVRAEWELFVYSKEISSTGEDVEIAIICPDNYVWSIQDIYDGSIPIPIFNSFTLPHTNDRIGSEILIFESLDNISEEEKRAVINFLGLPEKYGESDLGIEVEILQPPQ